MFSKFKCHHHFHCPLIFSQVSQAPKPPPQIQLKQLLKNPNKTLHHLPPKPPKITLKMSSWSCSSCTFLNPPSQKLSCQICQTPSAFPSIENQNPSSLDKWGCKACTFLNSYSNTNCEICDTRAPSIHLDYTNNDDANDEFVNISSSSDVGSIFFPLRKCFSSSLTRIPDPDDSKLDLGFYDKVRIQMGSDHIAQNVAHFDESSQNLGSNKRKFQEPVSEENNRVDNGVDVMDLRSADIVEDSECNIVFKRKRDPSDSFEKPITLSGFRDVKSSKKQTTQEARATGSMKGSVLSEISENSEVKNVSGTIKILSYNIWFRDELEGRLRMRAIGNLIHQHSPDVICFQEVNSVLYDILQTSSWWKNYRCSVSYERSQNEAYFCMQLAKIPVKSFSCKPFSYTMMSRELCMTQLELNNNKSLIIATTHLESPCPGPPTWDQMFSKERVTQAKEAINVLQQFPNVVFCGDMNWDDKLDGRFPFPEGWFDAWEQLRPAEVGHTYDTKSNRMLSGNRALQKRLDRFVCHLPEFRVSGIEMIGTEAIPGVEYKKEKKLRGKIQELTLPVYPSDHYGLLLTVTSV